MIAWFCDDCGYELRPGPRPLCKVRADGLHKVSQRQLEIRAELARMHLDALARATARAA